MAGKRSRAGRDRWQGGGKRKPDAAPDEIVGSKEESVGRAFEASDTERVDERRTGSSNHGAVAVLKTTHAMPSNNSRSVPASRAAINRVAVLRSLKGKQSA